MRIGTWNLAGRWTDQHRDLLLDADCNVWLLTEVSERLTLPGYHLHPTGARMAARRQWAAVASRRPLDPRPDPHPASAMAEVDGVTYCSSILPWRSCGTRDPWRGVRHAEKTAAALHDLDARLPRENLV